MKCPRCRTEMKRVKAKDNKFYYECPKCHKVIKSKREEVEVGEQRNIS